jgi:hypothetical protein
MHRYESWSKDGRAALLHISIHPEDSTETHETVEFSYPCVVELLKAAGFALDSETGTTPTMPNEGNHVETG